MRFGILGHLEVTGDEEPLRVAGRMRRLLLLRLLVDPNVAVAANVLAEDLWSGSPKPGAAQTLRSHVGSLRRILGVDRVVFGDAGYAVIVETGELDAGVFEAAVGDGLAAAARGDHSEAVAELERALHLWRGAALIEAAGQPWAMGAATRLEELRLRAIEISLSSRLALGEHGEVVGLAEAAVAEHPLRERLWGHLMVALYRCGRQADALRAYQKLRERLRDELGIEPCRELADLEHAILVHEPDLDHDAVAAPAPSGMAAAAPDERKGSATPTNLTAARTSFVGRAPELEVLVRLLEVPALVTVVGPGGIGKTRVATEAGLRNTGRFPGGVWSVSLAEVSEARLIPTVTLAGLGVAEETSRSAEQSVVDVLNGGRALLILDNCEHLIDECARFIVRLLDQCPGLSVLATSREPLGLSDEHVLRIAPLDSASAAALFAQRAGQARIGFVVGAENSGDVAEICRQLEGIPLALELAAARVRSLSPSQIADRLTDTLAVLDSGRRGGDRRQRTLGATIAWSLNLLGDQEQRAFVQLSVFRGGFTLAAAEAVADAAWDVVDELVDRSLLEVDLDIDVPRYRMLEPIRQYGWAQLADPQRQALQARHAGWAVDFTGEASRRVLLDQSRVGRLLEVEKANIAAAIVWSLSTAGDECALRIVGRLGSYWFNAGQPDALGWIEQALDTGQNAPPRLRAAALLAGATVLQLRPHGAFAAPPQPDGSLGFNRAAEWAAEAASIFRAGGSRRNVAWSRFWEAQARVLYEPAQAQDGFADALAVFRHLDEPVGIGWCLNWMAKLAKSEGRWDDAEAMFAETVERGRASGADHAVGDALGQLGFVAARRGDVPRGIELINQAVDHYRRVNDRWQLCNALMDLSVARWTTGDRAGTAEALNEVIDLAADSGFEIWLGMALQEIALILPDTLHDLATELFALWPYPDRDVDRWPSQARETALERLAGEHAVSAGRGTTYSPRAVRDGTPRAREALTRLCAM